MPLGGETIGTAYVRILADGSGFADDAKRQINDTRMESATKAAGKRAGTAYSDGFNGEVEKNRKLSLNKQLKELRKATGKFDAEGHFAGSKFMDGLGKELEAKFKDIGVEIFRDLNEQLKTGKLKPEGIQHVLDDLRPLVIKATEKIRADQAAAARKVIADQEKLAREILSIQARTDKDAAAKRKAETDQALRDFGRLEAGVQKLNDRFFKGRAARIDFIRDLENLRQKLPASVTGAANFEKRIKAITEALTPGGGELKKFGNLMDGLANKTGKLFGRGSRNDFLNFFGGFMSILPRAAAALTEFVQGAAEKMGELRQVFNEAGRGVKGFGAVLSSLATEGGLPGLVAALGVAVTAFGVFTLALGPMGAAISLLTGLILALAGSLAFALVGGIVAVAGALVPFAAALGVAAIAMTNLDKKSKFFKTLKKDWKDLQKTVQTEIFGKKQEGLENIHSLLKAIMPLIKPIATAIGNMLDSMGKTAKTKEFGDSMKAIGDAIGKLLPILGRIGGNIGKFLGEAFLAAQPMITEFLGWLEKITGKMADFGKTPKGGGKSGLQKFFDDAWTSAKKVGALIENVLLIIGDLFGAGKAHGDSIIDKLATAAENLHKWLSDPKNAATLEQWFTDAETLGTKIGEIVTQVVILIDKLDTPTNRFFLFTLLDICSQLIGSLATVAGAVDTVNSSLITTGKEGWTSFKQRASEAINGVAWGDLKQRFSEAVNGIPFDVLGQRLSEAGGGIKSAWTTVITGLQTAWTGFTTFISTNFGAAMSTLGTRLGEAGGGIKGAIGNLSTTFSQWFSSLPGKASATANSIAQGFTGLAGKIITRAGNIASTFATWVSSLAGKARSTAVSIITAFANLASRMIQRAGSIAGAFASWLASLPGKARTVANNIAAAFSGLARKMIDRAGSIVSAFSSWASGVYARARGVANDIVDAFRGLAGRIVDAIGTIVPRIRMPNIVAPVVNAIVKVGGAAEGLVTSGPQLRLIGEAGPEAVVPLSRSLAQVDPAVRELSAFAQGKALPGGSSGRPGKTIEVGGITINTPTENPRAVAAEVVAHMAAAAYI